MFYNLGRVVPVVWEAGLLGDQTRLGRARRSMARSAAFKVVGEAFNHCSRRPHFKAYSGWVGGISAAS